MGTGPALIERFTASSARLPKTAGIISIGTLIAFTTLQNSLFRPLTALDTGTERAVQKAFDALARGRTTITIAHRLSTVRNAGQIVVLDHGHVVETGDHASLMAGRGRYASLAGVASPGGSGDLADAADLAEVAA